MDLNITYGVIQELKDRATKVFDKSREGEATVDAAGRAYAAGILDTLRQLGLIDD